MQKQNKLSKLECIIHTGRSGHAQMQTQNSFSSIPSQVNTRYALLPNPAPAGARRHRLLPRARGWPGGLARAHRAAHRPVTARPRACACPLSRTTAGRRHTRPAAHGSGCPICPQPTCPPLSPTHLTGCRLVAGGPGQRHSSNTAWDGSGGPRSACGASLLAPVGCLPRQQRFSCLFQPLLCRFPSL